MSLDHMESVSLPLDLSEFDDIIDVRTPLEFAEDHLPGALNLPVLNNEQRVEVGTLYKEATFEARRLGARYASESIARHLEGELARRDQHWNPLLYCWRGGKRSWAFATVLRSIGWRARVLEGGYKAWRCFVMDDLDRRLSAPGWNFRIIAGLTGTGKTRLLKALRECGAQVIDLEGIANHRGSLLGSQGEQPSQKKFETRLHHVLCTLNPSRPVFAEAESNRIGSAYIPPALWREFAQASVIELTLPLPERVKLLLEDYDHFPRDPQTLSSLLDRLRKLRGHNQVDRWQELISTDAWPEFVSSVLEHHYDLCYRRPGSPDSNYQSPSRQLDLPDISAATFLQAARTLTDTEGAPVS
ncbi:MAG: tRNA 2-selenouridine(34) synthase MnmH [Roseibacillus sp.]